MAAPRPMTPIIQAAREQARKQLATMHRIEVEELTKRLLHEQGYRQHTRTIEKTQWVKEDSNDAA